MDGCLDREEVLREAAEYIDSLLHEPHVEDVSIRNQLASHQILLLMLIEQRLWEMNKNPILLADKG
jgi:hypothetical protein